MGAEARDVLVAAVGNPFSWSRVRYRAFWEGADGVEVESRTSLRLLQEALKPRETLVFTLDTLAATSRYRKTCGGCVFVEEAQCLPDPLDLPGGLLEPGEYRGRLLSRVGECIGRWFEGEGVDARVVAVPGFGRYTYLAGGCQQYGSAAWRLEEGLARRGGGPLGYQAALYLIHILEAVWRSPGEGGPLRLHIDLTHGLNYTTYALYRAAMHAARIYAAASGATVEVVLYNSEPFAPGARELNVWVVGRETVSPRSAASRLFYTALAAGRGGERARFSAERLFRLTGKPPNVIIDARERLRETVEGLISEAGVHAALAVLTGAPLLLLQAGVDAKPLLETKDPLREAPQLLLEALPLVRVNRGESRVEVTHVAALNYGYVKKMLSLLALAYYAARAADTEGVEARVRGGVRIAIADTEALKKVTENYVAGPAARRLAMQEISLFEKARRGCDDLAKDYCRACYAAEEACRRGERVTWGGGDCKPDERVFAAHAGLQASCLLGEAECANGKARIKLGYSPLSLEQIKETSQRLLEKAAKEIFEE